MDKVDRICFFGASVTKQKSGYAAAFKKQYPNTYIYGYGGMHLKDAGIAYIDECLKVNPTLCFVDWFSTGYTDCTQDTIEYLNTIIYKFTEVGCKLVFLMFPHRNVEKRIEFYDFCEEYLLSKNVVVLRVDKVLSDCDRSRILRDPVHTTKYGSKLYSEVILDYYNEFKSKEYVFPCVGKTQYVNVKRLIVEKEYENHISFSGNAKVIGLKVLGGPHSGIWKVCSGDKQWDYCSWNRWCYYTLDMMCLPCEVCGKLEIVLSQEDFDTTECKDREIDFTRFQKKMVLHEVIYVGEILEIMNVHDGKRIRKEVYAVQNLTARLRRIKRRILGVYSGE